MSYQDAQNTYKKLGIDTEEVIKKLIDIKISMHCWQADDVVGFENISALSGGIQTTGNYPYKANNFKQLTSDIDKAFSLIPGKHRLNLHAIYAVSYDNKPIERDSLVPEHFKAWVDYAKERNIGLDFNPTCFSHPMAASGLTLSSPDKNIRDFWIRHVISCIKISEYIGRELGNTCNMNIWVPDGYKDIPANRYEPRRRLKESLDIILSTSYDKKYVNISVESKVFGIGVESYTVGSHEFYMNYAKENNIACLLDSGHFHPTETISDKISSMLLFNDTLALHVSRPVRWDSDHVIIFDDELKEIAKEIVRCNAIDKVSIALDYFDASINRVAAYVIGMRNMQKALLYALLEPKDMINKLQNEGNYSKILYYSEELKLYPYNEVWNEFLRRYLPEVNNDWYKDIEEYEKELAITRK